MKQCTFTEAWVGRCGEPAVGESLYCEKHAKETCCSCGKQATHTCSETGQFVCGAYLCDDCEHATFPDGTNGGVGFITQKLPEDIPKLHIPKDSQVYKPWWEQEAEKEAN